MFGSLFSKSYRVARIFLRKKLVVLKITDRDVGLLLGLLITVELLLLIVWTAVARPSDSVIVVDADRPALNQLTCTTTRADMIMLAIACVFKGLIIVAGIALSILMWKVRSIGEKRLQILH